MITKPDIVLDEQRNFSDVINACFAFVRQEFKPLFKTVALYTFFPLLGLAVSLTFYFKGTFELAMSGEIGQLSNEGQINLPWGWYALLILSALVTQVVMSGVIYEYMLLYKTKGRGNFTPSDVARKLMQDIWALAGFSILTFLLIVLAGSAIGLIGGLLSTLSPIFIVPFVIIFMVGMIFIMVPLSLLWVVKVFEDKGYGNTLSRCFKLTKNSWWKTFGLLFVMNIIISTMGAIFQIPLYVYFLFMVITGAQSGQMPQFNTSMMLVFSLIGIYGSMWLYSLFMLAVGFHYTSLKEEKDSDSILNRIEKISETTADEMV